MRIAIVTAGSRGDVQPYVALGVALGALGHEVTLVTYRAFAGLAARHGLRLRPLRAEVRGEMSGPAAAAGTLPGVPLLGRLLALRLLARRARGLIESILEDTWAACTEADLAVGSAYGFAVPQAAERLGIPCCIGAIYPLTPTRAFPIFMTPPGLRLGGLFNRLSYRFARRFAWRLLRPPLTRWRQRHGMDRLTSRAWGRLLYRCPTLYAYAPELVPRPRDWPAHHHVTGFWHLARPPRWQPPAPLEAFLDAGPPPLFAGLASITARRPRVFEDAFFRALARTGRRALISGGDGWLDDRTLPENAMRLDSVPHDWLLPRTAAALHHGGPGTCAAVLAAGLPSLLVPGPLDEPFWARRLHRAGAALAPRPATRWNVDDLAAGIERLHGDAALRGRARALGAAIAGKTGNRVASGVTRAAAWIDRLGRGGDPERPP